MPTTEHIHLPLYTDEETPDLSTTGHYNHAMEIIDANVGELEAEDAELAEDIADEREARIAGDTALGSRIANAETEISANSADLTGIKGLTYGEHHVNFIESSNGEYSSPALEEIAEQIAQGMTCIQIPTTGATVGADTLSKLRSDWPNVALIETTDISSSVGYNILFPVVVHESKYTFIPISGTYSDDGAPYNHYVEISPKGDITRQDMSRNPYWANITDKPFSTIGTGLKVVSHALTLDPSAIPSGGLVKIDATFDGTDENNSVYGHMTTAARDAMTRQWPNVYLADDRAVYLPYARTQGTYDFICARPFETIHLSVAYAASDGKCPITYYLNDTAGINANTTFGDLTSGVTA